MHRVSSETLREASYEILKAADVPESEARIVSNYQVKANLVGHDSHGIILLPTYIERIKKGQIIPGAPFEITGETSTTARVNGNWGFGYVVTEKAMRLGIKKARAHNVSAITVFHQGHIGRLGAYTSIAAQEGMIAMITADSGAGPKAVAPFGGKNRRLGTNPLSIAIPSNLEGPVLLDMATSAVAAGKIEVARARKQLVPTGWIVDKEGEPTRNPDDYFDGGSILPLGGDQGHKGYALSFVVEVLSSILTGMGFGLDLRGWESRHGVQYRHNDACFISVFRVESFCPLEEFKRDVTDFAKYMKASPTAKGYQEVLYPGEIEWLTERERLKVGIPIEEGTWERLDALAKDYGLRDIFTKD
jgi:uncharacterized oxidoreductase